MVYEFDGTKYGKLRDMQAARRAKHPDLVRGGMNFTQAAHAAGASKRTGKAWRNGRTRSTGRNERPLVDWCRGGMDKPKRIDAGHLGLDERIAMRRGRTARRHHGDGQSRHPRSREPMAMTGDPPAEAADRTIPGHREGDLTCGAGNRSAIGTLMERTTRLAILLHLPDGHDAEHVQDAIISKMRSLPALLRNSPAWDQGSEPAPHARVSAAPRMQVYFCDPHSPWQRGTNENTNGLLRQHSPKGTDLSGYTEEYLDAVAMEPDDRPRKTPDHMKPSEKIPELIDDTATSTPTDNINTNCQQRCCDDH